MKNRVAVLATVGLLFVLSTATSASAQWRSVPYDADNFSAAGSMVWTVDEGDQQTFAYMANDRTMTVSLVLNTTSLSGTSSNELRVKIPDGRTAGHIILGAAHIRKDGGSPFMEVGLGGVSAAGDVIKIYRPDFSNHQLSSNLTYIYLTLTFDLQDPEPPL